MTQFKHVFSHLLRLHPKFSKPFRQHAAVTPTANTAVSHREPESMRKRAHLVPESTVQGVQSSTDTLVEKVEESEEDEMNKCHVEVVVQSVEPSTDAILEKVEEVEEYEDEDEDEYDEYDVDDEDEVLPEVFPYDLVRKTHHEMMTQRLYVAVTDNDCEIAALRTVRREKFTHIVRIAFDPLSNNDNITPSSWTVEEICRDEGRNELRLTCPALALHYTDKLTALTDRQLLVSRNYITNALPDRNDKWVAQGLEFPFSPEECEDSRVLIVGPTDRSVDVMAILVCYMAFLTGTRASHLLGRLQRLTLVHSHWSGDFLGKDSLDMANEVSKRKWQA